MIDIGLSKMALIGVVALIVIGPVKLPRVARTVGTLLGKAQRYVADVKSEVNRSMELDELKKMKESVEGAARDVEQSIRTNASEFEKDMNHAAGLTTAQTPPTAAIKTTLLTRSTWCRLTAIRVKNGVLNAVRRRSGTNCATVCVPKPCLARRAWHATGHRNFIDACAFCAARADVRSAALEYVRYPH